VTDAILELAKGGVRQRSCEDDNKLAEVDSEELKRQPRPEIPKKLAPARVIKLLPEGGPALGFSECKIIDST
jgi:hypothetical protein